MHSTSRSCISNNQETLVLLFIIIWNFLLPKKYKLLNKLYVFTMASLLNSTTTHQIRLIVYKLVVQIFQLGLGICCDSIFQWSFFFLLFYYKGLNLYLEHGRLPVERTVHIK